MAHSRKPSITATTADEIKQKSGNSETIAYWNMNVPEDQWTNECPEPLQDVDDFDREQLGTADSEYHVMSWNEVVDIIREL